MTGPRDFIIQRYSVALWDQITGRWPFIVTGPNFYDHVIPGSIETHREHRFMAEFRELLESFRGTADRRPDFAELLLQEGILTALWSVDLPTCAPVSERWDRSILQICREVPGGDIPYWGIEYLCGIGGPEHYQNMFDGVRLEPVSVPK